MSKRHASESGLVVTQAAACLPTQELTKRLQREQDRVEAFCICQGFGTRFPQLSQPVASFVWRHFAAERAARFGLPIAHLTHA
jgi:hypothetical protein